MKYEINKQTKREMKIVFENDEEYLLFIKVLMGASDKSFVIKHVRDTEYEKILDDNVLHSLYNTYKL